MNKLKNMLVNVMNSTEKNDNKLPEYPEPLQDQEIKDGIEVEVDADIKKKGESVIVEIKIPL